MVQSYWPPLLRFILASVRDRDVAETLAWTALNGFRGRRHSGAIPVAHVADANRHQLGSKACAESADPTLAANSALGGAACSGRRLATGSENLSGGSGPGPRQVRAVWSATADLSERQRTVFLLRFMEDMNIIEIAEASGLSESAVNVHLFRAVRAVRKRLGNNK